MNRRRFLQALTTALAAPWVPALALASEAVVVAGANVTIDNVWLSGASGGMTFWHAQPGWEIVVLQRGSIRLEWSEHRVTLYRRNAPLMVLACRDVEEVIIAGERNGKRFVVWIDAQGVSRPELPVERPELTRLG